jgi:hypothetical protein
MFPQMGRVRVSVDQLDFDGLFQRVQSKRALVEGHDSSYSGFRSPVALFGYPHEVLAPLPVAVLVMQYGDGECAARQALKVICALRVLGSMSTLCCRWLATCHRENLALPGIELLRSCPFCFVHRQRARSVPLYLGVEHEVTMQNCRTQDPKLRFHLPSLFRLIDIQSMRRGFRSRRVAVNAAAVGNVQRRCVLSVRTGGVECRTSVEVRRGDRF